MQDFVFKKLEKDIEPSETWIIDDEVPITGKKAIYLPNGGTITIKVQNIDITSDAAWGTTNKIYLIDFPVDKLSITNTGSSSIKVVYIGSYT